MNQHRVPSSARFLSRWLTFPAAIGFLLFYLVFITGTTGKIVESDIWWHLRNAKQFVDTHTLVHFDTYSYTVTGAPWVAHEWLSELAFYGAFRALGLRGLFVLYAALSAAIFIALYYRCLQAEANPKTSSIVLAMGILMATISFGPRPLLFGWLCFMALVILLDRFAATRRAALLFVLPPLFCLWINLHGSWLMGLIVFALFIVAGLVEGEWGLVAAERFSPAELKQLLLVFAVSAGALFLNPIGWRLVAYPFDLIFRQPANMANIDEWQSVNFHTERGKLMLLMLLALFVATLVSRRKWKLYEVLTSILALYVSLMYWRMQFFAALVLVPIVAVRLPLFPPYDPQKEKPLLNGAIMAGVLAMLFLRMPSEAQLREEIWRQYPVNALATMQSSGDIHRVFNDYNWGGYMIWNAPQIKTFIDGRADLFVYRGVFDDYLKIIRLDDSLELLNRYDAQAALLRPEAPVSHLLQQDPCWRQTYNDKIAVVFERNSGAAGCTAHAMAGK